MASLKALLLAERSATERLQKQVQTLFEAIRLDRQQRFGASSEKAPGQGEVFDEVEETLERSDQTPPDTDGSTPSGTPVQATATRKARQPLPAHLPRILKLIELPEAERVCDCGCPLSEIGEDCEKAHRVNNKNSLGIGALILMVIPAAMAVTLSEGYDPATVVIAGLALFGVVFAINSALHSYLILAYADGDKVSLNVGFYYMANAGGRLIGTILSGLGYQQYGLEGSLWISAVFIGLAFLLSFKLPSLTSQQTRDSSHQPHPSTQTH